MLVWIFIFSEPTVSSMMKRKLKYCIVLPPLLFRDAHYQIYVGFLSRGLKIAAELKTPSSF